MICNEETLWRVGAELMTDERRWAGALGSAALGASEGKTAAGPELLLAFLGYPTAHSEMYWLFSSP